MAEEEGGEGLIGELGGKAKEAQGEINRYIDNRVDEEIEERVKTAMPFVLALGAGILLAWAITKNGKNDGLRGLP